MTGQILCVFLFLLPGARNNRRGVLFRALEIMFLLFRVNLRELKKKEEKVQSCRRYVLESSVVSLHEDGKGKL